MSTDKSPISNFQSPISIENVSRWYGEILGINKATVEIRPGITGLVGPNGSGKSTLMNISCGLLRPSQGRVTVLGEPVWNNPELRRRIGYCSQVDHFYENFSGLQFLQAMLALHGNGRTWTRRTALSALERVNLQDARNRRIRTYSKGMRQRVKIALALAHQPEILVLDEPLNGLDAVGRREMIRLFADYASEGRTILISSHVLHEVEQMTDQLLMMSNGYVLAEGQVCDVRELLHRHPFKIFIRCEQPRRLASMLLIEDSILSIEVDGDEAITLLTRDPDHFYRTLNELILKHDIQINLVTLADENVQSIYHYLSGKEHH